MHLIALQGIRGGCGTTSLVAGLASALALMHKPVLAIDLCPSNLLGLHFGLPFAPTPARGEPIAQAPAESKAIACGERICVLPFDRHNSVPPAFASDWLDTMLRQLTPPSGAFVLLDIPSCWGLPGPLSQHGDIHWLYVLEADPACHVQLHERLRNGLGRTGKQHWLINRFQPASRLSRDLFALWRQILGPQLIPGVIHADEAVREALARKQVLGESAPHSLAMQDFLSLANWCIGTLEQP